MKILGVGVLNSNNYKKVSIHKNINVLGNRYKDNIKVSDEFSKSLKGKTDIEKRDEIVKYYLRNHDISFIYEDKHDILIRSKDGVDLIINRNQSLSKEVLKEVLNKYDIDRMKAYGESEVDYYWLMSDFGYDIMSMGYSVGIVDDFRREMDGLPEILANKRCMIMNIGLRKKYENGKLVINSINKRDKEFFNRMLSDIKDIMFYGYSNDLFRNSNIFKFKFDDKEKYIVIPRELSEFSNLLDENIKNNIDCKKLQYKMEDFK